MVAAPGGIRGVPGKRRPRRSWRRPIPRRCRPCPGASCAGGTRPPRRTRPRARRRPPPPRPGRSRLGRRP
ncbi:hypothetical protein FZ103_09375 [Streptomonospora sp. PA3]|nr:hypothetical protein [Streptomonospora sp. PA3]